MPAIYIIALQPKPFHVPHAHILSHIFSPLIKKLLPSLITPILISTELTKPSVENRAKAKVYTKTQLIKFGIVVTVCTTLLTLDALSSARKIANTIGNHEVAMPIP